MIRTGSRPVLVALCLLALSGCAGGDDTATAAADREKSKANWKLVLEDGGSTTELPLERMDIYLTENDTYPELFELAGTGVTLVGEFPTSGRVDYEEAFENLIGKPITVMAQGGDPREPKTSTVTINGLNAPVVGGTLTVEKVTGKWGGSEGNKTIHGKVELKIPGASGERTVTGRFAVHAVTWG